MRYPCRIHPAHAAHAAPADQPLIKGRYQPMRGFGSFVSAARFCTAHDEVRDYFRHRTRLQEVVPLGTQREQYRVRSGALRTMLGAAWRASGPDPLCSCAAPRPGRPSPAPELDATEQQGAGCRGGRRGGRAAHQRWPAAAVRTRRHSAAVSISSSRRLWGFSRTRRTRAGRCRVAATPAFAPSGLTGGRPAGRGRGRAPAPGAGGRRGRRVPV